MLVIRQIWFIGLVSLVSLTCLVSCGGGSDDDLLAPQPVVQGGNDMSPITFGGKETEEATVTRAGTQLSDKVTNFNVWGYKEKSGDTQKIFPGYVVNWQTESVATTSTNTNGWEYVGQEKSGGIEQSIKYWDWDASSYRFFAVTGWGGKTSGTERANTYEITMPVDVSSNEEIANNPYFSHLWFSTGQLPEYSDKQFGKPVTLEFQKPYARVRFIYNYVYPRESVILDEEHQKFKPSNGDGISCKSTLTITYPLSGVDIKESFTATPVVGGERSAFTENYDPEIDSKVYTLSDEGWYIVAPNTTQGNYTLSVNINGKSKTAVVPAEYMQWLPGYSYTYIFKIIDAGGITIGWADYAVTPWEDMEIDRRVYNW